MIYIIDFLMIFGINGRFEEISLKLIFKIN